MSVVRGREEFIKRTWRKVGSLPLFAVFCSVFQRTVRKQRTIGAVELQWFVVRGRVEGQRIQTCGGKEQKTW